MDLKKYLFEFTSIFVAVISAFTLDKCNSDRRDARAEEKILQEIASGLTTDKNDILLNIHGHRTGIRAAHFWRAAVRGDSLSMDSLQFFMQALARDFISIQNPTGYQSLRSRGLELVAEDSLRSDIIGLYEYDLAVLRKLEEEYGEMQFHVRYQPIFHEVVGPHLQYNEAGTPVSFTQPMPLSGTDRQRMLLILWKMEQDRYFILAFYARMEQRINGVIDHIDRVLKKR